jgi:hypothetical protein
LCNLKASGLKLQNYPITQFQNVHPRLAEGPE